MVAFAFFSVYSVTMVPSAFLPQAHGAFGRTHHDALHDRLAADRAFSSCIVPLVPTHL
jgi:hypothetical protein